MPPSATLQPRFSRQASAEYVNTVITGNFVIHFCCIDIKVLFFLKNLGKVPYFLPLYYSNQKKSLPKYKYYQFFLLH